MTLRVRKAVFRQLLRQTPTNTDQIGKYEQINGRQRSGNFECERTSSGNWGRAQTSSAHPYFFGSQNEITTKFFLFLLCQSNWPQDVAVPLGRSTTILVVERVRINSLHSLTSRPTSVPAIRICATERWWRHHSVTWSSRSPWPSTSSLVTCCKPHLDAAAAAVLMTISEL